jgi:carbonic anhydrase
MPPARRFAVLTCMDARLDPAKFAGLAEGDAHVIRNAGGRASDDAIRSLVISYKLLGTREWFVVHHSDCGMETFNDEVMGDLLASSLETAALTADGWHDHGHGPGAPEGRFVKWLTIRNLEDSVREDVARIRRHPLVPASIPIYGYIYDVRSGRLNPVDAATEIGAPPPELSIADTPRRSAGAGPLRQSPTPVGLRGGRFRSSWPAWRATSSSAWTPAPRSSRRSPSISAASSLPSPPCPTATTAGLTARPSRTWPAAGPTAWPCCAISATASPIWRSASQRSRSPARATAPG